MNPSRFTHYALRITHYASRFTFHVSFLIPLSLLLLSVSCSREVEQGLLSWEVTFFPLGAKVHFDARGRESVQHIRAFDSRDGLVAQLDIGGYPRRTESIYFRWEKGEMYRFEVTRNDKSTTKVVQAPQIDPRGSIDIAIPYGTVDVDQPVSGLNRAPTSPLPPFEGGVRGEASGGASLVLRGSEMSATVLLRNGLEAPVTFRVVLHIPSAIQVLRLPSIWNRADNLTSVEDITLVASGKFTVEAEVWHSQLVLKIPDERLPTPTQISGSVSFENASGDRWERSVTVPLRSATVEEIAEQLSIEEILMPTDAKGVFDPRQRPDAIYHSPSVLGGLGKWFGAKERTVNYFQPVTYQTVRLHNRGQDTIHILVTSLNRDTQRGEAVPFLAPPDAINAGTNRSFAFVSLPGGSTTAVPLPIYFNSPNVIRDEGPEPADAISTGRYERLIEVKVWGSDAVVLRTIRPLLLVTPNLHALFVTCFAMIATGVGVFYLLRFHQRFFSRFSTQQLILIALFGTTIFIAVSVPATLFSNLISALFGPISFLVTGLINSVLYFALLTSLLMLVRKSGTITLVSAVRFLLSSVMLGLFNPVVLLHTGITTLLLEAGFWVTRKGTNVLILAFIFGICDVLAVYTDIQLSITLYRLFYADWYILTRIWVDGFAYTFIGVLLGRRLGWGLWRVAE